MKSLSLLIGLMFISSFTFAQQKVVLEDSSEIKKELHRDYLKACNHEFHMGIYKNVVWIQGVRPFEYCQQYAQHMTKDL